jgi:hypothetical protein
VQNANIHIDLESPQYKNVANLGKDLEENFAQDVTIILDENVFRKNNKKFEDDLNKGICQANGKTYIPLKRM